MTDPSIALPEHLRVDVDDRVATLTFKSAQAHNPLSAAHLRQLGDRRAPRDHRDTRYFGQITVGVG